MSAGIPVSHDQAVEPQPAVDAQLVQARLDRLFRANRREDPPDWGTGTLRRYVEDYRLQREVGA